MIGNNEVSRLFSLYAELLLVHRQDERLSELLSGAAYRIRRMDQQALSLSKSDLGPLFRPGIVALLEELKNSATLSNLDELIQLTPAGLFDMMRIKGLGGKKLAILWHTAKVDTVEGLLAACKGGKLRKIAGFGIKTEKNIATAIEELNNVAERFHYADVADIADDVVAGLRKIFATKLISLCGDVRRHSTTVGSIEILVALSPQQFARKNKKKTLPLSRTESGVTTGHTHDEIPVTIYHTTMSEFYDELFTRTGNEGHIKTVKNLLRSKKAHTSEAAIYKEAKLPFINPEMREDMAEWDFIKSGEPLIETTDIRGVVHNHTTWSDGVDSLPDFINACKRKKYEYVVISEHSKNAHYAGGLKPEKVLRQFEEIDKINKMVAPFKVFKSIECDICVSGELDYDAALLKQFDLVIISIHQQLKMDQEKATRRLIRAIENPYTTVLGHMTGRQLLIRPGYPLDFKKVIDACAANNVVIEINANPYRLDMDWSHIPYALEKKVMISVNPDAHSIHEIDNIRWGVCAARKGGLTKNMTWNAMPLKKVESWLKRKSHRS